MAVFADRPGVLGTFNLFLPCHWQIDFQHWAPSRECHGTTSIPQLRHLRLARKRDGIGCLTSIQGSWRRQIILQRWNVDGPPWTNGAALYRQWPGRSTTFSSIMARTNIDTPPNELSNPLLALNVCESVSGNLITLRLNLSTFAIGILTTFSHCFKMDSWYNIFRKETCQRSCISPNYRSKFLSWYSTVGGLVFRQKESKGVALTRQSRRCCAIFW